MLCELYRLIVIALRRALPECVYRFCRQLRQNLSVQKTLYELHQSMKLRLKKFCLSDLPIVSPLATQS